MTIVLSVFKATWGLLKKVGAWLKAHPRVDMWLLGGLVVVMFIYSIQRPHIVTVTNTNTVTNSGTHEVKVTDKETQAKLDEALQTIQTLQVQINTYQKKVVELQKKVVTTTHTVKSPDGTVTTDVTTTTNTDSTSTTDTETQTKLQEALTTVQTLQTQLNASEKTIQDLKTQLASTTTTTTTTTTSGNGVKGLFGGTNSKWSLGIHPIAAYGGASLPGPKVVPYGGVDLTYVPFSVWIFSTEISVYGDIPYNDPKNPIFGIQAGLRMNL